MSAHRRLNPLTGDWVLVSPERLTRPWLGRMETTPRSRRSTYDPGCYLCPGNARAGDFRNPVYTGTFVFDNDFPALTPDAASEIRDDSGLMVSRPERGICRVVCFSPQHDASVADLSTGEMYDVVDTWIREYTDLGSRPWVTHVQIFENRGTAMGASNPHPHCQVWANAEVPDVPRKEHAAQASYREARGGCLLCDYLSLETAGGDRVVWANDTFTVLVPYWAVWPFELLVLPNRHVNALDRLEDREKAGLADTLRNVVTRFDRLFDAECPYSMGLHQRPTDGAPHDAWHLHAHYYPPVLRSAAVHKFMVGYELLAAPQRDLTPELAAAVLREAL